MLHITESFDYVQYQMQTHHRKTQKQSDLPPTRLNE